MAILASNPMDITEATRAALRLMVKFEERRVGRQVAYSNVAQEIDASFSWVKKQVLGDAIAGRPGASLFLAIKAAYDKTCELIEQEHELEVARRASLQGEIDAVANSFLELARGTNKSRTRRTTTLQLEAPRVA